MTPEQLSNGSFDHYGPKARTVAVRYLPLLKRLPIVICPSFLAQIRQFDTSFPAEQSALEWQCDALAHLSQEGFNKLKAPFDRLHVSDELRSIDWVHEPESFISALTAFLWSSGQLDAFRAASVALFATLPPRSDDAHRLTFVVFGRGAETYAEPVLHQLSKRGVAMTALKHEDTQAQILNSFRRHSALSAEPYANWYVDGGELLNELNPAPSGVIAVSYAQLTPLRKQVLGSMETVRTSGTAGAEAMRDQLAALSPRQINAAAITQDPILQRFYTELFTMSSGPQIFSTSFVQWAGRELARRARPRTLLLRYMPRQTYRPFDELLQKAEPSSVDPEGSLRDAEMGAWYNWIEMNRITAAGKGTFIAWREGTSQAVIVANNAPAGTVCASPMSLDQALQAFA